jgi:nitroimidazol reductase NimA-like FMN-containing flavoprotein (pyridoxamine 5'-phosphate oxidase superfamily)
MAELEDRVEGWTTPNGDNGIPIDLDPEVPAGEYGDRADVSLGSKELLRRENSSGESREQGSLGHQFDHLEALDRAECMLRLEAHGVGRIGVTIRDRPAIYPVNYTVDGGAILFVTRRGGDLDLATDGTLAAFEIDGADSLYHEGWSVLVSGRCFHITGAAELAEVRQVPLTPWAGEDRDCFVRIALDEVTGRRIHHRLTS